MYTFEKLCESISKKYAKYLLHEAEEDEAKKTDAENAEGSEETENSEGTENAKETENAEETSDFKVIDDAELAKMDVEELNELYNSTRTKLHSMPKRKI